MSALEPSESSGSRPGEGVRIGNAEREEVVTQLQTAFAEGRLEVAEFDQRVSQVYAARTAGELVPLTADLPVPAARSQRPVPAPAESDERAPKRSTGDRTLRAIWQVWATAVLINVVIWAIVSISSQELIYFWPIWVAGPWGAVLLATTLFRDRG